MIANLFIHIVIAIFGVIGAVWVEAFHWNLKGAMWALIVASFTQSLDMIRVYQYHKNRALSHSDSEARKERLAAFKDRLIIKLFNIL